MQHRFVRRGERLSLERKLLPFGAASVEMHVGERRGETMSQISVQRKNGGERPAALVRRELEPFRLMRDLFRWDPFQEMRPLWSEDLVAYSPAFDVKETKDSFVFKADLPGIKEQDLEVTSTGNRLSVSGKREAEKEEKDDTYYTYERSYGSFTRTFTLPEQAEAAHVKAELKNGELTIVVPKTPAAVAKRIAVAVGDKPKT
jgi:HSP20 family protein